MVFVCVSVTVWDRLPDPVRLCVLVTDCDWEYDTAYPALTSVFTCIASSCGLARRPASLSWGEVFSPRMAWRDRVSPLQAFPFQGPPWKVFGILRRARPLLHGQRVPGGVGVGCSVRTMVGGPLATMAVGAGDGPLVGILATCTCVGSATVPGSWGCFGTTLGLTGTVGAVVEGTGIWTVMGC